MPRYRTRLFEIAQREGWSMHRLSTITDLTTDMLYKLKAGHRGCGVRTMQAIQRAFPDKTFEELFYLDEPGTGDPPTIEGAA